MTTLDMISRGRAVLGIGTGWFELEHAAFGFEFGTLRERFDRLEEALAILVPMLRGERPTFEGRFYRVKELANRPAPLQADGPPEWRLGKRRSGRWGAVGELQALEDGWSRFRCVDGRRQPHSRPTAGALEHVGCEHAPGEPRVWTFSTMGS